MEKLPKTNAINSHKRPSQPFFVHFLLWHSKEEERELFSSPHVPSLARGRRVGDGEGHSSRSASKQRLLLQPKGDIMGQ